MHRFNLVPDAQRRGIIPLPPAKPSRLARRVARWLKGTGAFVSRRVARAMR